MCGRGAIEVIRLAFHRSLFDWNDDGVVTDYGWYVTLLWRGQHRVRWNSTRGTSPMWPGISRGADENCNRAITVMLWPLGHLNVWWEPKWRTDADGQCDACIAELADFAAGRL
jgi:hypothetical protein